MINIYVYRKTINTWKETDKVNRETISIHNENFDRQQNLIKQYENHIYKKDLELNNKKATIKFLSDQNIVLNNELQNIEENYSENSEAIKVDRIRKGEEKFKQTLQTSK